MLDYHVHCSFSCDSPTAPEEFLRAAEGLGIDEICFTDHIDYEFFLPGVTYEHTDFAARERYLAAMPACAKTRFKRGIEVGLLPRSGVYERSEKLIREVAPDYVIASVHILGEAVDPYAPEYFQARTRKEGYVEYLTRVLECASAFPDFDAVGHMFFPARCCDMDERDFRLSDAPDLMDALFRLLISRGQTFEINTWDFRNTLERRNYAAVYRRFATLGGEFVTIGSDAHALNRFGFMLKEGYDLAREAGLRYVAGYDARKPVFYKI